MSWQVSATIIIGFGWLLYWALESIDIRRGTGVYHGYDEDYCDYYEDDHSDTVYLSIFWDWPSVNGYSNDHPFPILALAGSPSSADLHSICNDHYSRKV